MPLIKAEVDNTIKSAFRHAAKTRGMTETELLRQMITKVVGSQPEAAATEKIERSNQVNVRFTDQEIQSILKRSRAEGFTKHTAWLVGIVRKVLFQQPTFTADEIDVLRESNREIAAIGRNLNQIARAINVDFREGERLKRVEIKDLAADLKTHRGKVARLIDQSMNRWSADDE